MQGFEDRLSRAVAAALLGGCTGGVAVDTDTGGDTTTDTGPTTTLEAMCSDATLPDDYQVATGFVQVAPGAPCPDAADAQLEVFGCTFLEWQGVTCAYLSVDHDQVFVNDGYGGYFADAATAGTGTYVGTDVVDVCWYDGVFYLPPDHPTCGRPLLRDGEPVLAEVRPGPSPWSDAPHAVVVGLTDAQRERIAAHWLESARLEHASVASFAQVTLDLLRFGAPPELLRAAQLAALDEIEHARLCFALASSYRGEAVGPGPLPSPGAGAVDLVGFAEALVREGCVGETLAAVDAAARLAVAWDPAVRAALEVILRDESAHAALAWRTLRWVLDQDADGAIRAHLARVFADEASRWTALPAEADAEDLGAHGLLGRRARARELCRAWRDVVAPTWAAA